MNNKLHWTRTKDPRKGNISVDDSYVESLAGFLRTKFQHVIISEPQLPDEDFAMLCAAEVFVQGGGGFSSLVGEVVKRRGGTVIKPRRGRRGF